MNSHTCIDELAHVSTWAKSKNLVHNLGSGQVKRNHLPTGTE